MIPRRRSALYGFQDVSPLSPGDVNRDGFADLYGAGFAQDGPDGLPEAGRAWIFSGKTGAVIYEFVDPDHEYGGQFAWSMTRQQTYYGNGKARPHGPIYIRAAPHHQPPPCDADSDGQVDEGKVLGVNCEDQRGETNRFNFPRGKHIRTLELPAPWN